MRFAHVHSGNSLEYTGNAIRTRIKVISISAGGNASDHPRKRATMINGRYVTL